MKTAAQLKALLESIDRKSYPAYKETRGSYRFDGYILNIEHVQGDPFASPSKLSIAVDGAFSGFPVECYKEKHRRIALADLLLRAFGQAISEGGRRHAGSGKSGLIIVSRPGQEILERSALVIREKDGQVLVRDREPITPFLEKMRSICDDLGVSIVLVAGSQGEFFHVADTIVQMDAYVPVDITREARRIAADYSGEKPVSDRMELEPDLRRPIRNPRMCGDRVRVKVQGKDAFMAEHETVDIRCLEQVVDAEQTQAIAKIIIYMHQRLFDGKKTLPECMGIIKDSLDREGLEFLGTERDVPCNLAMPRTAEISAAVNRCRWTKMEGRKKT